MHNLLTKAFVSSSLIFSVGILSLGCGENTGCCDAASTLIKPTAVISNLPTTTLDPDKDTLAVNGTQGESSQDDGTIIKYEWRVIPGCDKDFSDGTTTLVGAKQTLPIQQGDNTVCLRVTDNDGNQDTTCHCVKRGVPTVPTAAITVENGNDIKTGCLLSSATSTPASGTITTRKWTLESKDGVEICAGNLSDCRIPTDSTASKVCLSVTDGAGDNTKCYDITAHQPTAMISVTKTDGSIIENNVTLGEDLNLSCAGSHDDCSDTAVGNAIPTAGESSCELKGQSWKSVNGDCTVAVPDTSPVWDFANNDTNNRPTTPYFYIKDCDNEIGSVTVGGGASVTLCGTPVFDCVKFWSVVTDRFGKTAESEAKIFNVN